MLTTCSLSFWFFCCGCFSCRRLNLRRQLGHEPRRSPRRQSLWAGKRATLLARCGFCSFWSRYWAFQANLWWKISWSTLFLLTESFWSGLTSFPLLIFTEQLFNNSCILCTLTFANRSHLFLISRTLYGSAWLRLNCYDLLDRRSWLCLVFIWRFRSRSTFLRPCLKCLGDRVRILRLFGLNSCFRLWNRFFLFWRRNLLLALFFYRSSRGS